MPSSAAQTQPVGESHYAAAAAALHMRFKLGELIGSVRLTKLSRELMPPGCERCCICSPPGIYRVFCSVRVLFLTCLFEAGVLPSGTRRLYAQKD